MVYRCKAYPDINFGILGRLKQKLSIASAVSASKEFSSLIIPELNKYYAAYGLWAELVEAKLIEQPAKDLMAFTPSSSRYQIDFDQLYGEVHVADYEGYSDPVFAGSFAASVLGAHQASSSTDEDYFPDISFSEAGEMIDDSEEEGSFADSNGSLHSLTFKESQIVTIRLVRAPTIVQQAVSSSAVTPVPVLSFTQNDLTAVTSALLPKRHAVPVVEQVEKVAVNPIGTININYQKVDGVFFKVNHVDVSNSILVDIEDNTLYPDNKKLLALCYDCAEAEETLREAIKALPQEQVTKRKLVQQVLEMVIKTGRNYAKRRLPDLIQVLKQTKELIQDDLCPKVSECIKEVKATAVSLKDTTASKIAKIGSYLKLTKKLNEGAQPRKLIGALMMVAGVALVIAAAALGWFTAGTSLLLLATGVPAMLIASGAAIYKLADTELAVSMKALAAEETAQIKTKELVPTPIVTNQATSGFSPDSALTVCSKL